jgi:hypothetical protein
MFLKTWQDTEEDVRFALCNSLDQIADEYGNHTHEHYFELKEMDEAALDATMKAIFEQRRVSAASKLRNGNN